MFKNTTAWASFSVDNLERAKEFYGTTLGIPLEEVKLGIVTLKLKGGNVNVFLRKQHVAATFTILNFQVDDISKTIEELSRKGIVFEHYDGEEDIVTNKKGIAEDGGFKAAWFKDPAGNLLQLIEAPAS
jgi:predicted enzyme related to lactoylglutathione lyase